MTDEEYRATMDFLVAQASMLKQLPLQELLDTVNKADAVGFIIDPTAYQKALQSDSLRRQKRLVEAAINYANSLE